MVSTSEASSELLFSTNFEEILNNVATVKTSITQLTMQLKNLEKDVKKKMKAYDKISIKPFWIE